MTFLETDCVIAGGGPAGLMLGLLLARAGIPVIVVEKHADFLRDFRGDTIHPSTQELLYELGLLDEYLARPHADADTVRLSWQGEEVILADFRALSTRRPMMSFMPQWDFLDLLATAAERYPSFRLLRSEEVTGVFREGDVVSGIMTAEGTTVRAKLVIGADGRDSVLREAVGLRPVGKPAAMDVLWFRLPRGAGRTEPLMQAGSGLVIAIDRGEFYQVAHVIPAGTWTGSDEDLVKMKTRVAQVAPGLADRAKRLTLRDVHLLRVRLERLRRWYDDGILFIGDAAHAMSPAGGVGINLAIQDAVAAARILIPALRGGRPGRAVLRRVQRRRMLPTRLTQFVQRAMQPTLLSVRAPGAALPPGIRLLRRFPFLSGLTGRFVGLGLRRESARGM